MPYLANGTFVPDLIGLTPPPARSVSQPKPTSKPKTNAEILAAMVGDIGTSPAQTSYQDVTNDPRGLGAPAAQEYELANRLGLKWDAGSETYYDRLGRSYSPQQLAGGMLGTPGGQPQGVTPQDRVNARAQFQADARLRDQTRPQTTLADLFGIGGGDWASQWGNQADPRNRINQNFYQGLGLDTGIFNSPTGPYGQLQQAAVLSAPARNDRQARMYEADVAKDIAGMKYGTAKQVLGQLSNLLGGRQQLNGFETDYGASAMLRPTNLRRYF